MVIHAIVPFEDPPDDFLERIKKIDQNAYISHEPRICFVRSSGNSRFIADKVGFTNTGSASETVGIVITVQGDYAGFAMNDLWDYLSVKK